MSINAVQFMSLTSSVTSVKQPGPGQPVYEAKGTNINGLFFEPAATVSAQVALTNIQVEDIETQVSQITAQITRYRVGDTYTAVGANSMNAVANVVEVEFSVSVLAFTQIAGVGIEATAICTAFIQS